METDSIPARTDVVIVGAGLAGLVLAWMLSGEGRRATVVESGLPGGEASGQLGGQVRRGLPLSYVEARRRWGREKARALWRFTDRGHALLREFLITGDEADCGYRPSGHLDLACAEASRAALREEHEALAADGFPSEIVEEDEIRSSVGSGTFCLARFTPDDATVAPGALAVAVARRARSGGARLVAGTRVDRMVPADDGVAVRTSAGVLAADAVVYAAGAGAARLDAWFADRIDPVRRQSIVTTPCPECYPWAMTCLEADVSLVQGDDGRVVADGLSARERGGGVGSHDRSPTEEVGRGLVAFLHECFPRLGPLEAEAQQVGVTPVPRDGIPLAGPLPDRPREYACTGWGRLGLGHCFAGARVVADWILRQGTEVAGGELVDPRRATPARG